MEWESDERSFYSLAVSTNRLHITNMESKAVESFGCRTSKYTRIVPERDPRILGYTTGKDGYYLLEQGNRESLADTDYLTAIVAEQEIMHYEEIFTLCWDNIPI